LSTGTNNKGEKIKFESFEWYHPGYLGAIAIMSFNYQWSGTQWNMMTPKFIYQKQPQLAPTLVNVKEVERHSIRLYPNPGKNRLWVNSDDEIERIVITNNLGQLVYEKVVEQRRDIDLDISSLSDQIYIVSIFTKNGSNAASVFVKVSH
jgi:hypothetical protein